MDFPCQEDTNLENFMVGESLFRLLVLIRESQLQAILGLFLFWERVELGKGSFHITFFNKASLMGEPER